MAEHARCGMWQFAAHEHLRAIMRSGAKQAPMMEDIIIYLLRAFLASIKI